MLLINKTIFTRPNRGEGEEEREEEELDPQKKRDVHLLFN